jgi:hypothetical protein
VNAADRAIRVSATAALVGVAGIAAYVSYQHAYQVIAAHGETGPTARLEPATIDGVVYCSSMVILYAARHHLRAPGLARWLLALGIAATLAANLAHGWSHGPIGAVAAAWPAASLVGSYELLLWLIRTASTSAPARVPLPDQTHVAANHHAAELRLVTTPTTDPHAVTRESVNHLMPDGFAVALASPADQSGPRRARRTRPRTTAQRTAALPSDSLPTRAGRRRRSTPQPWPPTAPASTTASRSPSGGSPPCSARPPDAGHATAWPRPAALPSPSPRTRHR